MPRKGYLPFLIAFRHALSRKPARDDILSSWIAPSSLYKLFRFICQVSNEIFADCFNESGVLRYYCSNYSMDEEFGALGTWEDVEHKVEGGAGNPPFHKELITAMVREFEEGVQGPQPYCRIVILPVGERYRVLKHVEALTSEGELLISVPAGSFPFMNEQVLLTRYHLKPKPGRYQLVGVFLWCNREYLLKYRPPVDIEDLYVVWIQNFLCNSDNVVLRRDAFLRVFPPDLRSSDSLLGLFVQDVVNNGCRHPRQRSN